MIKKSVALVTILINTIVVWAQTDIDAMRYSQGMSYGDARFMAMGGAFGSLGANISCMNFNPAGIAMYKKGEFVITPGVQLQTADATHYGTSASDFSAKLSLATIGFVSAWTPQQSNYQPNYQPYTNGGGEGDGRYGPGYSNPNHRKQQAQQNKTSRIPDRWAFGINFNRVADYNYHTTINGYVPAANSITSSMANAAHGISTGNLNQFYEGLGYSTGAIVPYTNPKTLQFDSTGTNYAPLSAYTPGMVLQQTKSIQSSGRTGELTFALAHSFSDKLYIGGALGIPFIKYNYQSTLTEFDYKNADPLFQSLQYQESIITNGAGINFKAGGIYRFNSGMKIGVYGQTATYYKLTDNYQNTMSTNWDSSQWNTSSQSPAGNYTYKLRTPGKAGVSVSYVFKKLIAFSVDGEYVNYANARLASYNTGGSVQSINVFDATNQSISTKYRGTANLKAGIEFNVRPVVLRAGFASYGSPFGDVLSGKFVRNSFSGGLGFRGSHKVYLDLGLIYTKWSETYYVIDPLYVNPSNINYATVYVTATIGIKFN
ncbi:MAG: hypothetical protein ACYDEC_14985 [Bacteroidia bacterium]